jgi:hypothetical protein
VLLCFVTSAQVEGRPVGRNSIIIVTVPVVSCEVCDNGSSLIFERERERDRERDDGYRTANKDGIFDSGT